jgi:hypothetical protein
MSSAHKWTDRFVALFLVVLGVYFIFVPQTYAITQAECNDASYQSGTKEAKCCYSEKRDNGTYLCEGTNKSNEGGALTCQYDDAIGPKCDLIASATTTEPTTPSTTSTTPSTTSPSTSTAQTPEQCRQLENEGYLWINGQCTYNKSNNPLSSNSSTTNTKPDKITSENYDVYLHDGIQLKVLLSNIAGCEILSYQLLGGGKKKCADEDPVTGSLMAYTNTPSGGLMGTVNTVMVALYTNPSTSTGMYLANLGENMGVVSPAYAQENLDSAGAGVIRPVFLLWKTCRDAAYVLYVLIFIVVGFMIMFRRKLNQNTAVTVQTALPGLVIGLVLVTFSYFLSALIIDLSFVGMSFVALFFKQVGPNTFTDPVAASGQNIFVMTAGFIFNGEHLSTIAGPVKDVFQAIIPGGILRPNVPVLGGVGGILGGGIGFIVLVIVIIGFAIQMIRVMWQLLTAYLTIMMTTAISPLIILLASVPGQGNKLPLWWKTVLGNVLVFPAVFAAFLFAGMMITTLKGADRTSPQTMPFFYDIPSDILSAIIGYAILMAIPQVSGSVKKAMGVPELGAIAQEAFKGAQSGMGLFSGAGKGTWNRYYAPQAKLRQQYKDLQTAAEWGDTEARTKLAGMQSRLRNLATGSYQSRLQANLISGSAKFGLNPRGWVNILRPRSTLDLRLPNPPPPPPTPGRPPRP